MSSTKKQMKSAQHSAKANTEHGNLHPAILCIGHDKSMITAVEERLIAALCAEKSGCKKCPSCQLIFARQHYAVTWLKRPAKLYGRSDMAPIFHKAQFALGESEQYFFVIERADLMTDAAANSLLKLLEEPPRGYKFFLGAPHAHAVLPTVRSRCLVTSCASETSVTWEQLLSLFTEKPDLSRFMSLLEDRTSELHTVHESQACDFIDQVYDFWVKRIIATSDPDAQTRIRVLDHARCFPPMPGSTVLFLKNLFLQLFMRSHSDRVLLKPGTQRRLLSGRFVPVCPFVSD